MIGLVAFLLAAAATPIAPPKGVNDSTLGAAEDFKTIGPARVCFNYGGIDLIEGETAYLSYLGIHSGALHIVGPAGDYKVSEGEIFAKPKGKGHAVAGMGDVKVVRFGHGDDLRYALYGRPDFSPDEDRLMVWLSGLRGGAADLTIIRRITPVLTGRKGCKQIFEYGMFFDDGAPK